MRLRLLTAAGLAAALTVSAAPAEAQQFTGMHTSVITTPEPPVVRPFPRHFACRDSRFGCQGDGFAYADGEWALYNNRAFEPDSYNDWWNDRPDRAYPRWVQEQRRSGTCDPDRIWWSGSGWHC